MKVAMLHNRIRTEERMLLDTLEGRGVRVESVDIRETVFSLEDGSAWSDFDLVFDRTMGVTAGLAAVRLIESFGVRCVNSAAAIEICSDKLRTSIVLEREGIPTPRVRVAMSPDAALDAVESIGYPAVIKPTVGSWGRLIARVGDRESAESIIEHRTTLGGVQHGVHYVQEHVDKPGRDLRVFVVGGEPVAAIARSSEHWITNTAHGGRAEGVTMTEELRSLARRCALAVGGVLIAVDLLECPRRGLLVNELNHSMEFRNSISTTGVDIPALIAARVETLARGCRAPVGSAS